MLLTGKVKYILSTTTLVLAQLLLAGCDQNAMNVDAFDTTLVYCSEGSPDSFDPHTVTIGVAFDASARQVYNRLVEFKRGTTEITPSLAKRWKIRNNGTVYRFYLREDVQFHSNEFFQPTRNFNADDVIFSFMRQKEKSHPFHSVGNRDYSYFNFQGLNTLIKSIKKIDQHTIEFELERPFSPFISVLAMEFTSIMSAEYANVLEQTDRKNYIIQYPIGTGPFQLVRYQVDAFIRYKAFEHYWRGKEPIEHLVFAITPDPSLRFARVTAGECDVMSNPLPIHLKALDEESSLKIVTERGLNIAYWAFNTRKPPLDNRRVRQALNHAINRDAILEAVYYGSALKAKNPIPPGMWSYNDEVKYYEYNPQLARNLLFSAGFEDGFEIDIWAFPEQRSYNPNAIKTAELIQQDLKEVGVKANIITYEVGTFLQKVKSGEHITSLQGWIADNGDPDNFFNSLLSCEATIPGQNSAFWCNEEFDAIIKDAQVISNRARRAKLYQRAQQIFKREAPWLTIAHTQQNLIVNDRVKNLTIPLTGGIFFSGVKLEPRRESDMRL
ncbi:ABC transporter substrate-binding protein [Pleionea sediminis]|uniref:ABC transporter substrate-binding protein n=1 Tax=Pleionea sediminis TaxID=2569479 RepID=UPI001185E88E|nr:ABC transporter substrate-binding protein [Pleionea sediminis]